jgi:DsbC/DsbD-like thiol-disulfide interchange protein
MSPIRVLLLILALAAPAQTFAESAEGAAEVSVLPGWRTERGTHMAALRIELRPGWKTYWRAPGDAGIPPRFGWSGSRNIASVAFHWPRPEVYVINGMRSIGYHDQLILPMEFTPKQPGQPMHVEAEVEIGVCHDICVPVKVRVSCHRLWSLAMRACATWRRNGLGTGWRCWQ